MINLNISVDMDHLQSSIKSSIRPAIDKALSEIDFEDSIKRILLDHKTIKNANVGWHVQQGSLVDVLIKNCVEEYAREYIKSIVTNNRPFLNEAINKMMRDSENRLTKAFAKAMVDAVDDGTWKFDLDMRVTTGAYDGD